MGGDWALFLAGAVSLAGIYVIYTLGLNIQFGFTGLANLGYVAFFAIGAYASVILSMPRPGPDVAYIVGYGLPMWAGMIGGSLAAGFFALLIGIPTLKIGEDYFVVVTFAFSEVLRYVLINEKWLTNGTTGFYGLERPFGKFFSGRNYEFFFLFLIVVAVIIAYLVMRKICNSPFGRLMKGVRENEPVCLALGKNIYRVKMKAFIVGAMFAGFAGSLYARYTTLVVPEMFIPYFTFVAWLSLMIGGRGNNKGAILGCFIFVLADQFTLFVQASAAYAVRLASLRAFIMGALLIIVLRWLPAGILKEKKVTYR
ncbi:MAG: branched-chain amino acid ABC transporter permease [Candidatus Aerophobetes bacterium]